MSSAKSKKKSKKGVWLPSPEQQASALMGLAKMQRHWHQYDPQSRMIKSVTLKFDGTEWMVIMRGVTHMGGDDMVCFQRIDNIVFLGDVLLTMAKGEWKLDKYGNGWRGA